MATAPRPLAYENPLFKLLLWLVFSICLVTLGTIIALAFIAGDPPTKVQERVLAICEYAFTTTLGALVGLLCGRGAAPDVVAQVPAGKK